MPGKHTTSHSQSFCLTSSIPPPHTFWHHPDELKHLGLSYILPGIQEMPSSRERRHLELCTLERSEQVIDPPLGAMKHHRAACLQELISHQQSTAG